MALAQDERLIPGTKATTGAFKATDVVSAGPATLMEFSFVYKGNGGEWLHLFDATAKPADTAIPSIPPIPLANGSSTRVTANLAIGSRGQKWANGIVWAISSNEASLTYSSGSASLWALAVVQ